MNHPILVVDDNPDLLEAYRALLDVRGYEVREARSGQEALSILNGWRPHLILTDISMPEMDGFELIAEVDARFKGDAPPVLVCSAFEITEREAMLRGARRFLSKPMQSATLLAVIEELLGGPVAGAAQLQSAKQRAAEERALGNSVARRYLQDVRRDEVAGRAFPWLEWLRTYFDCAWAALYLLDGETPELVAATGEPAVAVLGSEALRVTVADVIEARTSLAIADAQRHSLFQGEPAAGKHVGFFIAVPLVAPGDIAVGSLCIADPIARRCEAESLVILEAMGRRGATLLVGDSAADIVAIRARAPVLVQANFEVVVEMALRTAARRDECVELAIVELINDRVCVEAGQRLWQAIAGPHVAVGAMGPHRIGLCHRGAVPAVRRNVQAGIEALRERGLMVAAGVVSAAGDSGLSEPSLTRMAEQALKTARSQAPAQRLTWVVVGPGGP